MTHSPTLPQTRLPQRGRASLWSAYPSAGTASPFPTSWLPCCCFAAAKSRSRSRTRATSRASSQAEEEQQLFVADPNGRGRDSCFALGVRVANKKRLALTPAGAVTRRGFSRAKSEQSAGDACWVCEALQLLGASPADWPQAKGAMDGSHGRAATARRGAAGSGACSFAVMLAVAVIAANSRVSRRRIVRVEPICWASGYGATTPRRGLSSASAGRLTRDG